jgi:hypothetical protein
MRVVVWILNCDFLRELARLHLASAQKFFSHRCVEKSKPHDLAVMLSSDGRNCINPQTRRRS